LECKNKSDSANNSAKRNHLKIIQKIHVQRTGKARNEGTTETAILGTAHSLRELLMYSTKHSTLGITVHVAWIATTE
jgi:hypothetical protein